jgi:rod shape-determining protein MreD
MASLNKSNFLKSLISYLPLFFLFFSVLNEFDLNYLKIDNFSFNFVYILVFYWTLRGSEDLGYFSIFIAGIINDVVVGLPIGISSFCYLLICVVTSYIRQITLSPKFINDWFAFIVAILLVNSIQVLILDLIFLIEVDYMRYLINSGFTFIFYPIFYLFFNLINDKISLKPND